jgi:manganese efflux pump family protein
MGLWEILLVALGLAMDAFAVSLGIGATRYANRPRPIFRLAFHFGLFQALMPILGWLVGTRVVNVVSSVAPWIAMALLAFVGGRMIRAGLDQESETHRSDPSRGGTLVLLSVAVSLDAFAVGLSLAMLNVSIWYPAAIIGVVTASLALAGLMVGNRLGRVFGKRMEIVGGVILIVIGLRILLSNVL